MLNNEYIINQLPFNLTTCYKVDKYNYKVKE